MGAADRLRAEGLAELARLRVIRGSTPARVARRRRRARALLVAAATLAALPVGRSASAAGTSPHFSGDPGNFPFGIESVGRASQPDTADLDGDGDLDVLTGSREGPMWYFENTGSSTAPAFPGGVKNPFGLFFSDYRSSPDLVDIDGDGDLDLFTGDSLGNTRFFRNTGDASTPAFASEGFAPFGLNDIGEHSTPAFADIDDDGDFDAFIGERFGSIKYFANLGNATTPNFPGSTTNAFGLTSLGFYNSTTFADHDGDGDLDAFIGVRNGYAFVRTNSGTSVAPAFATESTNPFGLTGVDDSSAPELADIDGDGDLDVLTGDNWGRIAFQRNTGTSAAAAFASPSTGASFGLTLGPSGYRFKPDLADMDGDGDLDAIAGDSSGNLVSFTNTGSASAAAFATGSTNASGLQDVGIFSTVGIADLDGDGDNDVLAGEGQGSLFYFQNSGTSMVAAFLPPTQNPFGLVDIGFASNPELADLNGDGDLDLVVGDGSGFHHVFTNTGSSTAPAFSGATVGAFGLTSLGDRSAPDLADLDGDGDLDALVGHYDGPLLFFRNTGSVSAPAFASPLTKPFGLLQVTTDVAPALADLDDDGDLDVLVGDFSGNAFLFENEPVANLAPTDIALDNTTVAENSGSGVSVGDFTTTDPDVDDVHVYTLVAGAGSTDNASFTVDGTTLETATDFNFEAGSTKTIRVRTDDGSGNTYEEAFTITITDVAEGFFITDVYDSEGSGGGTRAFSFTITRNGDLSVPVKVKVKVAAGTASLDNDVKQIPRKKRTIKFAAGEDTKVVNVKVYQDARIEPDETFTVNLSSPVGAAIVDGVGDGYIFNDDF